MNDSRIIWMEGNKDSRMLWNEKEEIIAEKKGKRGCMEWRKAEEKKDSRMYERKGGWKMRRKELDGGIQGV